MKFCNSHDMEQTNMASVGIKQHGLETSIYINGTIIPAKVNSYSLSQKDGEFPVLTLEIPCGQLDAEVNGCMITTK